jgi:hypothetical protein
MGNPTINSTAVVYPNSIVNISSFTATAIISVTAGDFIGIMTRNSATVMSSITDNAVGGTNTYSSQTRLSTNPTGAARNQAIQFWFCLAAKTTGTLSITFTFSGSENEAGVGGENFVAFIWDITPASGSLGIVVDTASLATGVTPNSSPTNRITTAGFNTISSHDLLLTWASADNINLTVTFTAATPLSLDNGYFPSGRFYCGTAHNQYSAGQVGTTVNMGAGALAFLAIMSIGIFNNNFGGPGSGDSGGQWMDSNSIFRGNDTGIPQAYTGPQTTSNYIPGILSLLNSGNIFEIVQAPFISAFQNLIGAIRALKVR